MSKVQGSTSRARSYAKHYPFTEADSELVRAVAVVGRAVGRDVGGVLGRYVSAETGPAAKENLKELDELTPRLGDVENHFGLVEAIHEAIDGTIGNAAYATACEILGEELTSAAEVEVMVSDIVSEGIDEVLADVDRALRESVQATVKGYSSDIHEVVECTVETHFELGVMEAVRVAAGELSDVSDLSFLPAMIGTAVVDALKGVPSSTVDVKAVGAAVVSVVEETVADVVDRFPGSDVPVVALEVADCFFERSVLVDAVQMAA